MRKFTILLTGMLLAGFLFLAAPIARADGSAYHIVAPGETLWSISVRYGVTLDTLVRANGLVSSNWIYAGQLLVIPRNAQGNQYHTVRPGETVWSISNEYGVSAWALVQQNRILSNLIYVGQTLVIPQDCCSYFEEPVPSRRGTVPALVPKPTSVRARVTPTATPRRLLAAKPYTSGTTGFDVSYPQCDKALPTAPHSFIIVGINGGRAFIYNTCFDSLYDWAARTSTQSPSIYMNINYVVGSTADNGLDGPAGHCLAQDETCKAYNYGHNAGKDAYERAGSRTAKVWWIDLELSNTWSTSDAMNAQVIQGAIDFFQNRGVMVGIYSSRDHWNQIVGNFEPKHSNQALLPLWIFLADNRAEAPLFCSSAYAFGGGTPWLVQYPSDGFDGVYVC